MMGIEFIRKAAPSFNKGLDRSRIELATPKLFMQELNCAPRAYAATAKTGTSLSLGDEVGVCLRGDEVIALFGLAPVATFNNPPADLISALRDSFGEACGRVEEVHILAGSLEISIC